MIQVGRDLKNNLIPFFSIFFFIFLHFFLVLSVYERPESCLISADFLTELFSVKLFRDGWRLE